MGWISCCVRDGREPFRARASADIEEAPRLSAENRREAYVPESWCPPEGSPRRYILRKGAKGGVRGTARGKLRFPAWVRRSSALAPPEQCQPAGWRAEAGTSPARAPRRAARGGLGASTAIANAIAVRIWAERACHRSGGPRVGTMAARGNAVLFLDCTFSAGVSTTPRQAALCCRARCRLML